MALVVAVHIAVSVIIWEGRISDALLAVKLPVVWTCALGLAFVGPRRATRWPTIMACVALLGIGAHLGYGNAPQILAVTRDRTSEAVVQRVAELAPPATPTTVWMPWNHDYWALTYAQRYRDELPGLSLVYHIASTADILDAGERLVTPEETFYVFAPEWWRNELGGLALSAAGDRLVEIKQQPRLASMAPPDAVSLNEAIAAVNASVAWAADHQALRVSVTWYAQEQPDQDYSVGVHLLGTSAGSETPQVVAQADSKHPVYGWYPTTGWHSGELVADQYAITPPPDVAPSEVRLFMYTQDEAGFRNTEAITLPVP